MNEDDREKKVGISSSQGDVHIGDYSPRSAINIADAYRYLGSNSDLPDNLSPIDYRKNQKLAASKELAFLLWRLLTVTILVHLASVVIISGRMAGMRVTEPAQGEQMQESISRVDETSKTIYAFLGPLVAAVTGYYFSASENSDSSDS